MTQRISPYNLGRANALEVLKLASILPGATSITRKLRKVAPSPGKLPENLDTSSTAKLYESWMGKAPASGESNFAASARNYINKAVRDEDSQKAMDALASSTSTVPPPRRRRG